MEADSLNFARPAWLVALLLVPVLAGLMVWSWSRSRRLLARIVAPRLREALAGSVSPWLRFLKAALGLGALALGVIALAGPQLGFVEREVPQRGRDIILAIDTSRSMLATDFNPDRLTRAKLFARDLLEQAEGDRLGVIAFAGSAFLQAPLTLDRNAVMSTIEELDTSIIPKGGTNIAEAIRVAERAFGKGETQSKAMVIVSDGEELDADGVKAAREAASRGIRIFTVGAGTQEGSLIPLKLPDGKSDFVRDPSGRPVNSRLDVSRLREIAAATGGFYVGLGPDAAAQILRDGIARMETEERGAFASRQPLDRYAWPLAAACGLLCLRMLLGDRRRAARLAILAFGMMGAAHADQGLEAYQQGAFDKALEYYEQRLERKPDSPELLFNAGATAYQLGDYDKAVQRFSAALAAERPEDGRAASATAYNLANALVRRGEKAESADEKKADWKDAIRHYESVLKASPDHQEAKENLEIVRKLLEELEEQQKQQQKNQDQQKQQKQDQKKQDQQQREQQNRDQQNQEQQQKDQDQQNQNQQNQERQDQQQKDQQQENQEQDQQQRDQQNQGQQNQENQEQAQRQDQQPQDQENQAGDSSPGQQRPFPQTSPSEPPPIPTPTPGDKKEGELKAARPEQESATPVEFAEPQERDGQMSERQARALLNSLRNEEERVQIMRMREQQETLRDW